MSAIRWFLRITDICGLTIKIKLCSSFSVADGIWTHPNELKAKMFTDGTDDTVTAKSDKKDGHFKKMHLYSLPII